MVVTICRCACGYTDIVTPLCRFTRSCLGIWLLTWAHHWLTLFIRWHLMGFEGSIGYAIQLDPVVRVPKYRDSRVSTFRPTCQIQSVTKSLGQTRHQGSTRRPEPSLSRPLRAIGFASGRSEGGFGSSRLRSRGSRAWVDLSTAIGSTPPLMAAGGVKVRSVLAH